MLLFRNFPPSLRLNYKGWCFSQIQESKELCLFASLVSPSRHEEMNLFCCSAEKQIPPGEQNYKPVEFPQKCIPANSRKCAADYRQGPVNTCWVCESKKKLKSLQVHTLLTSIISTSCISLLSAQTLHVFTNLKTRLCLIRMAVYTHCPSHGWVLLTKKPHCRHKVKAKFGGGGQKLWPHSNLKQTSSAQCVGLIGWALKPQLEVMSCVTW